MQAGKCCRKATCSPFHFVVQSLGPGLYREDLKRKRDFISCYGKLFYQFNVVKLVFNKDCQSRSSQRGAPGSRADRRQSNSRKSVFHLPGLCCGPICQTFDRTDTWWLLKSRKQKIKKGLSSLLFICGYLFPVTCLEQSPALLTGAAMILSTDGMICARMSLSVK